VKRPFLLVISGFSLLSSPLARAIVDVNHNGLSDLWEKHYNSGNLFSSNFDPLADPDGDSWTHTQEAAAGSHPFDANPPNGYLQPAIVHIPAVIEENQGDPVIITPEAVTVTWQTLVGKHYTLLFSPDLQEESWIQIGRAFVGSGSEVTYGFEVSGGDKQFWRVAVTDADTDGDTLTDAEEHQIGSSRYFRDTDGDGIDDFTAYHSGLNPAGEDSDEDGTPDNVLYSVQFELQNETHNVNNDPGSDYYKNFIDSDNNFRYLTSKNIRKYSSSGAALSPDVTEAKRILTSTYLGPGKVLKYPDSRIEYPPPRGLDRQLDEGESLDSDPSQTSVVGPTTTPSETKTITTTTTAWRIKKQGNTIRSGVHTEVAVAQQLLSDGLTYQNYWATYVKPLAWTEFLGGVYGPAPAANILRGIGSDKWAAETIRDYFRSGNFYLSGIISSPSLGYFSSYGEDIRLKRVRWRWVRFNPLNPFDYEYASPPAAYQKTFHFLVEQTEGLGPRNNGYGQNPVISTKETKGTIEIECTGGEGAYWKEIPSEKFNTYRIDDPTHLAAIDFTKWGYSTVSLTSHTVEVSWKAIDGFDNVDDHVDPWKKPIHGKRIFPDFKNPGDTEIRHKLEVIVKTSPALFGKTVYVKSFDVDDSTSEDFDLDENGAAPVIDTNGKAGGDNLTDYLSTPQNGQFWTGSAWGDHTAQGTVDANGETKFIFRVGMQPGSNYRVVASLIDEDTYEGVQTSNPAAPKYLGPELHQNGSAPASPLLTVWRRLWVENDSMKAPELHSDGYLKNDLTSDVSSPTVKNTVIGNGQTIVQFNPVITDQSSLRNLENGTLILPPSGSHQPVGSFANNGTPWDGVTISGEHPEIQPWQPFRLYDDDDFGLNRAPLPRNDLIDDTFKNVYKPAFIEVVDAANFKGQDYNPNKTVDFYRNYPVMIGLGFPLYIQTPGIWDDAISLTDSKPLWVGNLIAGYQGEVGDDRDPNNDALMEGITPESRRYSIVYVEAVRDHNDTVIRNRSANNSAMNLEISRNIKLTAAHEIGHMPGGGDEASHHAENMLMDEDGYDSENGLQFSPKSISRFRKTNQWQQP
jgi:hypothetical protein